MAQNVGVDISKQRLDVAILETREVFQVSNDKTGWMNLAKRLERRQIAAIGLEASGGYERGLIRALLNAGPPVRRGSTPSGCAGSPTPAGSRPRTTSSTPASSPASSPPCRPGP